MLEWASCGVPLQVEDGHDLCPKCLGVGHLREALTDPCMNCSILPLPVRENRLRQVENLLFAAELPPSGMPQPCSGRRGDALAEECRSPRRKRPRLERPSRQEVDSLRAEVEQLKALLKAPEPTPAFQAAAAWESGEDLEDDGISVRASNSEFQSLEDQLDPFPDPRDREGDPPSIGGNDGSGNSLGSSVSSGRGQEPCPLRAIILAAFGQGRPG
ncbi:hypothetical protein ATANTOWER_024759 [Ataeniobius toweri]|uniref:Uncharacterized protein n=1 Tax=Ataeniobius toweri TaxID=208326 RepID=A0ABU7C0V6_9TELE|nr:hypothetical protein [Ataeniobius toweri]